VELPLDLVSAEVVEPQMQAPFGFTQDGPSNPYPTSHGPRKENPSGKISRLRVLERGSSESLIGHLTEVALQCQRVLQRNPNDPKALASMSLVAQASGQAEAAVLMARAAVAVAPGMGAGWVALGQALKAAKRFEEAERAYAQAIRLDGMDALARTGLGELKAAAGRPREAVCEFTLALDRQPALVPAHMGLGYALAGMGRNSEALDRFELALVFRPRLPEAEFAAALVLAQLGRPEEAERRYRRALVLRPDFAAAWMSLGHLLREQGREFPAEAALLRAVTLRPDMVAGWLNLALLERERRNPAKAEAHLRKAFALNPDEVETQIAWCRFRVAQQDQAGAWAWLRWALIRQPDHAEAVNMRGILRHLEGKFMEAVGDFERAEALGSLAASSNRGNALLDLGRDAEALNAHETAVKSDPANAGAAYNLALTQLRLGDWERGWPGYEARWRFREVHRGPRVWPQPRWRGEPLEGRRILLHAEQGLGDTIQFCRYAELVAARGGRPILQVRKPVARLLHSLPSVRAGRAEVAVLGEKPPAFDLECALMSLPAVFATTVETVPAPIPYLHADPALAEEKWASFPNLRTGLRVGIAWAGNPRYKADAQRSVKLETLFPLLRTPCTTWISLQKGAPAAQLAALPSDVFVWDGSSRRDRDLAETAALVATLDLVITTDTCIAHLAGAMGKPVWILLPHLADWRWMQQRDTTPWYPTAGLLRQRAPGDWAELVQRAEYLLGAFQRSMPPRRTPPRLPAATARERAA
jgi:tetratricopeptide (TPR) repeat protein